MAPASSSGDIKALAALAASMDSMRSFLERMDDEARQDRKDTNAALAKVGERQATTEERLLAVSKAQESTAASVMQGYRQHDRAQQDANERFDLFKREVQARFEKIEQDVSAVVPAVADATTNAAVPWRNKVAKTARQSWWMGALVVILAIGKFFVPSAAALGNDWRIFVRSVNGADKIVSGPPPG